MKSVISNYRWRNYSQNVVGRDAQLVYEQRSQITEKQQESISSVTGSLKDMILEIFYECSVEDWDSYGAEPISDAVVHEAFKFVDLLPSDITMPYIIPEPSGDIGILWRRSEKQILSLSITFEGLISYAFIFGKNEGCGRLQFFDEVPQIIAHMLQVIKGG